MKMLIYAICLASLLVPAQSQTQQSAFRPFSATIRSQYWTESGKAASSSITFARSRDGSFVYANDVEYPLGKDREKRGRFSYRFDVQQRLFTLTEPFVQAAVARPIVDDAEMRQLADTYGSCRHLQDGEWKEVGRSTVLNFDVVEVEVERTSRSVQKKWVAPDLQCFALREISMIDGRLRMQREAVSLETKEPQRSLFEPPPGYELLSPLELEDRYQAKFPGNELFGRAVHNMEDRYRRAVSDAKARHEKPQRQ